MPLENKFQIENKLLKMKGKSFMYKQKVRKVLDYRILDNEIMVSTDGGIFNFKADKAAEELSLFLPAEDENTGSLVKFEGDKNWNRTKVAIYGLIDKLNAEDGSKFVEQAKLINETAKTLIDMMKVEVEVEVARVMKNTNKIN